VPAHRTVFMFSGQGSHFFHMGRELFEQNDVFRDWMRRLDAIAHAQIGSSVLDALYAPERNKGDAFDRTLLTHPAIYMTEIALAQALIAGGLKPDLVFGSSLGSFAAAAIGGYVAIEDALLAVIRQAQVFERRCEPGGMIAIMTDPSLYDSPLLRGRCTLAGVNFDGHFTVSAPSAAVAAIESELKARGLVYQRLPVSFAFHSDALDVARDEYLSYVATLPLRQGDLPLVCCERAEVVNSIAPEFFWNIARRPIRFRDAVDRLERDGPHRYVDVGPAGTLATFLKYALPAQSGSSMHPVLTPYGRDRRNFDALLAAA